VLGDPDITIHFFPSESETHLRVHLGSPKFQDMGWSECHDSIWDYLRRDPEIANEDLFNVSSIATAPEAVELI
jgi:hypothetical protein